MTLTLKQCKDRLLLLVGEKVYINEHSTGVHNIIQAENVDIKELLESLCILKTTKHKSIKQSFWEDNMSRLVECIRDTKNMQQLKVMLDLLDIKGVRDAFMNEVFYCLDYDSFKNFVKDIDLKHNLHLITDDIIINSVWREGSKGFEPSLWHLMRDLFGEHTLGNRINQNIIDRSCKGYPDEARIEALQEMLVLSQGRFINSKCLEYLAQSKNIEHFTTHYPTQEHLDQITNNVVLRLICTHFGEEALGEILHRMKEDDCIIDSTVQDAFIDKDIRSIHIEKLLSVLGKTIHEIDVTPAIIDQAIGHCSITKLISFDINCKDHIQPQHLSKMLGHIVPRVYLEQLLDIAEEKASSLIHSEQLLLALAHDAPVYWQIERLKDERKTELLLRYLREEEYKNVITPKLISKICAKGYVGGIFTLTKTLPYIIEHEADYAKSLITKDLLRYCNHKKYTFGYDTDLLTQICMKAAGTNLDNVITASTIHFCLKWDKEEPGLLRDVLSKCGKNAATEIEENIEDWISGGFLPEQKACLQEFHDATHHETGVLGACLIS